MIFELLAVVKSVQVSILGLGLALRGSEGSMTRALSVMRHEQRRLHWQFYFGLFFFHIATACFCAAIFDVPTKIVCISCLVCSFGWMVLDCQSVAQKLWLPPAASLWRSEVDRRPSSRRGVRCSCTGALIPQASTPSRPSSLADGASSAPTRLGGQQRVGTPPSGGGGGGGGGMPERSLGRRGSRRGSFVDRLRLPDPLTGSFRHREYVKATPVAEATMHRGLRSDLSGATAAAATPSGTLSGASAVRHPDEYAVRHLISATVYDWASQQTAQWRCRGQQTVQAALSNADWFRPGGGHRNEFSATRLDAAEQRAPLTADAQRPSSSTRGNAVASRRVGGSGATGATVSSSSQTPVQKVRRRFLFSPPASGKSGASGRSEGGTPTQRGAPRAVDARGRCAGSRAEHHAAEDDDRRRHPWYGECRGRAWPAKGAPLMQ